MAIVKILKSSSSFNGVSYNESRVKKGEAVLLEAANFNPLCEDSKDYISELKGLAEKNKRVKNPQLHVVISLKGKASSPDELLLIAKKWLTGMGYIDNPYLIYLHNNTQNSHIHIVTSRVDKYGRKIDHNFERIRSNRILNEINGIDLVKTTRTRISQLLHYSFSTKRQFFELCREDGFQILDNDKVVVLKKGGVEVSLSNPVIDFCSQRYHKDIDDKRKKKIQSLIFKYAKILDKSDFINTMKKQFGLSFKLYGKDNSLYGFSIIDYNKMCIYKGSELFSVKKLNDLLSLKKEVVDKYNLIVNDLLKVNKFACISTVNEKLSAYGVATDGQYYYDILKGDVLGSLSEKYINKINYNNKLQYIITNFKPSSDIECRYLCHLYNIRYNDLNTFLLDKEVIDVVFYRNLVGDMLESGDDLRSSLNKYGINLVFTYNDYILVDLANQAVLSSSSLGISYDDICCNVNEEELINDKGYFYQDDYLIDDDDVDYETNVVNVLSGLLSVNGAGGGSTSPKKRKKR